MIDIAFVIGNLNKEHGGAQQLLYDICRRLPKTEFRATVYYLFGKGTFEARFKSHGVNVVPIEASGNYDIRAFRRLVACIRNQNHDIVQTNSPISGVWGRLAAVAAGSASIVSVEHNVHTSYAPLAKVANGVTLPLADAIVGVSQTVSDSYFRWEKMLVPTSARSRTIRNGVDIDQIKNQFVNCESTIQESTPFKKSDKIMGTVGRLHRQKGYKYLIQAFEEIKNRTENVKLLIIGGGPKAGALKQHAEATGYMDDIHFTGYVPTVYPFLPAFDVAVFPSLWEGFGLTPVEAMIAEVPVVASDIPVFREIIGDGGILVEPKNSTQIAAAVTSVLLDSKKSEKVGKRGYELATSEYSISRTVKEYEELYRELYT